MQLYQSVLKLDTCFRRKIIQGKSILSIIFYISFRFCCSQEIVSLEQYLLQLQATTDKSFFYKSSWIDSIKVDTTKYDNYLQNLREAVKSSGLKVLIYENKNVFIYPNALVFARQSSMKSGSLKTPSFENEIIGDLSEYDPDREYKLWGVVSNELGEPLAGSTVLVGGEAAGITDQNGYYEIALIPGNYEVEYRFVGLDSDYRSVTFNSSGELNISLFPNTKVLNEVVVRGNSSDQGINQAAVGVQRISLEKLEKLPSFLGNVDALKSATVLPGVAVSGESSSYLNVRGGANDQTLLLMNNATIYNPGHLFGFFSVYNGDFVSDFTLFKGNIPARYGIRSSSVLDVRMNKWASKKFNVYGGIGLINSNLGIKAKLLDEKLDIHLGGRISYLDWMLRIIPNEAVFRSSAQFGDLNLSTQYLLDSRNTLSFSGFMGTDYFKYSDRIIYQWRSSNKRLQWSRLLKNNWVLESEIQHSSLSNSSEGIELNDEFLFKNGIEEWSIKSLISNEKIEAGFEVSDFSISPGEIGPTTGNSMVQLQAIQEENLLNVATYASYAFRIADRVELNTGLRSDLFYNYGPSQVNQYRPGAAFTDSNLIGTRSFSSLDLIHQQFALSPRVGIKYRKDVHSLRASYSRINQFLHLISNTVLVNPTTVWKGSDQYIPRTVIDQYSMGYQYDLENQFLSLSIDGFYKTMNNLIDYRDGAQLIMNENLEQEILRGQGTAYGLEFLFTKDQGRLSGMMSYTYSRTWVTIRDELQSVEINRGERYPYYTDRPHSIKASIDFKANKKWTISSNFIYQSGAPISAPRAVLRIDDVRVPYFSQRNAERIPDYHRLDLVFTFKSRIRKTKQNNDRWVLTLYNLYGRDNIATIFFSGNEQGPSQPFGLVNIGRMVPTITYKFEF